MQRRICKLFLMDTSFLQQISAAVLDKNFTLLETSPLNKHEKWHSIILYYKKNSSKYSLNYLERNKLENLEFKWRKS